MIYWGKICRKEMNAMEHTTPSKSRTTLVLTLMVLVLIALLTVLVVFCLPHFTREPDVPTEAPTLAPTLAPTEPPTEAPTEAPTEPLVDLNPYSKYDFQYEGKYLKLLNGESITGIDVSSYQGEVDWEQVKKAGIEFAMIRLAYRGYETGKIVDDKYAQRNLVGAFEAGLEIGVYFFSQAITVEEAIEEAEYVLEKLDGYEITMPVVFDWEHVNDEDARSNNIDKRTLTDCAKAFLDTINEAGYKGMLYFNTSQSRNLFHLDELDAYPFWLALYSNRMTFPYKVEMWQYTCTGKVPGINGDCDINVYFPEQDIEAAG